MAILKKFKVAIVVDGEELPEYPYPLSEQKPPERTNGEKPNSSTSTEKGRPTAGARVPRKNAEAKSKCSIQATHGKNFSIKYASCKGFGRGSKFAGVTVRIKVDGKQVSRLCYSSKKIRGTSIGRSTNLETKTLVEPYQFAEIAIGTTLTWLLNSY